MNSLNIAREDKSTNHEVIQRMILYCLNLMRKRSSEQQLRDFSEILSASLELSCTCRGAELELRYAIGSVNATVKGYNEPMCVSECKRKILHKLRVLCGYSVDPSGPAVVAETEPENREPSNDVAVRVPNDLPPGSSGARDVCVAFDELGEHEALVAKACDVLHRVEEHTLSENADALLDVLVLADRADGRCLGVVTDAIVRTAVRRPDIGGVYARLCSETVDKASANPRLTAVADAFRGEVVMTCNSVISALPPRSDDPTAACSVKAKKVRARALETCKFMGRLFMAKNLKMSRAIKKTVLELVESHDAHRLECLCGLLRIIGPRFEMVDQVSRRCSAARVYGTLEEHAADGTLPSRTVRKIGRLVLERNRNWLLRDGETATPAGAPGVDGQAAVHAVSVPKKFVGIWESS